MTDDRRRTIDEKCEIQVFLAADAAVVETVLESVWQWRTLLAVKNTGHPAYKEWMLIKPVSGLEAGLAAGTGRVEPVMGAPC